MCKVLLFVDMEFPRGRGNQMEKSWKFEGVGESTMKPLGKENPGGWGVKLGKTLLAGGGGGVWIFSGTTHCPKFVSMENFKFCPPDFCPPL